MPSFVKLREVRLGWAVPQSLVGGCNGYRMNVALVGRNLADARERAEHRS